MTFQNKVSCWDWIPYHCNVCIHPLCTKPSTYLASLYEVYSVTLWPQLLQVPVSSGNGPYNCQAVQYCRDVYTHTNCRTTTTQCQLQYEIKLRTFSWEEIHYEHVNTKKCMFLGVTFSHSLFYFDMSQKSDRNENRNVHISGLNGELWDMEKVHCGNCEIGPLIHLGYPVSGRYWRYLCF